MVSPERLSRLQSTAWLGTVKFAARTGATRCGSSAVGAFRCDRAEIAQGHADVDQVEGTAPRLAAALRHGCIKASALARRRRLELQRFEAFLDRS